MRGKVACARAPRGGERGRARPTAAARRSGASVFLVQGQEGQQQGQQQEQQHGQLVKSSQVKSSQAKPSQNESSQAK